MKLILASIASNVIQQTEEVFGKPFNQVKMAVVPTAVHGEKGDTAWLDAELKVLNDLGLNLIEVNLENKTEGELRDECKGIDAIYMTGGNTYYLLYHIRQSGFDKVIHNLVKAGVIYIGSSAGSLVAGQSIDIARRFDDPSVVPLEDYTGLELVNYSILPHINQEKYLSKIQETLAEWKDKSCGIIGLTDFQALINIDNYITLLEV